MKVRRNLLIALSLLSLGANAQRIKGSDTVLPVAQQTAERFMNQHPEARVTVTGGGTGVGISALMDHTTDIAMASRPTLPVTFTSAMPKLFALISASQKNTAVYVTFVSTTQTRPRKMWNM